MMKFFSLLLFASLLIVCASSTQSQPASERCKDPKDKVSTLVNEYRELRIRRSQLAAGEFDADLSASGGRLSKVLSELGVELGHPPFTKADIVACLGEPDAVKTDEKSPFLDIYKNELKKKDKTMKVRSDREFLIYHWRGWHDFLFFISEGGDIVDHGWWFAYD